MRKVALMTWFHYHNFGTSLQVTASTYVIRKLGYQADVVNYIPHGKLVTLKGYKDISYYMQKIIKKIKNRKIRLVFDEDKEQAFIDFLNRNINLTNECKTDSDLFLLNEKYDSFVCGSDQIWAPSLFNSKYFLDFVEDTNKMIAYAPSIGLSKIEDKYVKGRMKECIDRYKYLSIREEQGKQLIKELCGKQAKVVLDPTLLLTSKEWDTMAVPTNQKSPYILCYFLGNNKESWQHVEKLSKKTNIPLKIIPVFSNDLERSYDVVKGVGPGEFLDLVKNASFVCTDSFHGTSFSIIYEKPFYIYERFSNKDRNSQNSRIYNILKLLGLESRLVKDRSVISDNPLICGYNEAKRKLKEKREESISYLRNALNESTSINNIKEDYKITNTCCGCGVCSIVCSQKAIEIKRDNEGFLNAFIDQDKCVRCELCKKVCPFNGKSSTIIDKEKHNLYMLKSTDKNILNSSSSGGAGYEISKALSTQGYDVVGCIYDKEKREAVHKIVPAGDIENLKAFQGSKYIQSNTYDAFQDVISKTERAVIFGTPCQIAGMDRLLKLKKRRENYILVDLICHGVPTQHLWNKYLKEGSKKYGYGLNPEVKFRDKSKDWREKHIFIEGNGKKYSRNDKKDLFYRFFELGHCFMSSCYECNYRTSSAADIRMGDYWGPRYKNDKNGVSMVITMTANGGKILYELNSLGKIQLEKKNCEEYWTVQCPRNSIKPVFYNELIEDLKDDSIELEKIASKYCAEFELYKKAQRPYSIVRSVFRKGRHIK